MSVAPFGLNAYNPRAHSPHAGTRPGSSTSVLVWSRRYRSHTAGAGSGAPWTPGGSQPVVDSSIGESVACPRLNRWGGLSGRASRLPALPLPQILQVFSVVA